MSDSNTEDTWAYCRTDDSCEIAYHHLANQDTDPFLFLGKVVDQGHPQWKRYRKLLRRYPDVVSCLVESEHEKEEPNLLKLDWEEVGTGSGAEVCVFRIARSLSSLDKITAWLEYHSFRVGSYDRYRSEKFIPRWETQPVSNMGAYWSLDQYREKNPSLIVALTGIDLIQGYELILGFSENGQVVGASSVTPTK
ncbi:hypothetical protein [Ruegeria arenilitoris]|uniref:hypothetical protein n=1 Tax=Ruegeria arenilitoris TaxID=1173585 RepID=UPI001480B6E2|nr:hypothetical protein [Ruegeria arenilitoris]